MQCPILHPSGWFVRFTVERWGNSCLLESGSSPAIHPGLHQPNILAVVAQGNKLNVYVNHQHLASTIDTTYAPVVLAQPLQVLTGVQAMKHSKT